MQQQILISLSSFGAAERGLPLGMTFDMGSWHWAEIAARARAVP